MYGYNCFRLTREGRDDAGWAGDAPDWGVVADRGHQGVVLGPALVWSVLVPVLVVIVILVLLVLVLKHQKWVQEKWSIPL